MAQWGMSMVSGCRQRLIPGGTVGCAGEGLITFKGGMRHFCAILLLLLSVGPGWAQGGAAAEWKRIDSVENWVRAGLREKNAGMADSISTVLDRAVRESRRIGYTNGVALALACQASLVQMRDNDFALAGRLAQQSLDTYSLTDNKNGISLAYYTLGYSLFAQSRFDDAIFNLGLARDNAHRSGDSVDELHLLKVIGQAYRDQGDYGKAFDIQQQCVQMAEETHDQDWIAWQYFTLGDLFIHVEDYTSAQKYFRIGFAHGMALSRLDFWNKLVYAELLTHLHEYDSALYYYQLWDSAHAAPRALRFYLVSKGEYYLERGADATALPYLTKSLQEHLRLNDRNQVMRCVTDLARAEMGMGHDANALAYARQELRLAQSCKARQNIRDACQIIYTLYDRAGRTDSAYAYFRRYIALKDSVLNDQLRGRFASYGFEQQIRLMGQEKRLDEECLRTEMLTKNLLILGILALLLLSAIYIWVIRLRRKNEEHRRKRAENELEIQQLEGARAKTELMQRAKELEVQALRSQMNPHFIFNCLNAINRFILSHETEAASDYLTKFSRLIRMIMNHSRHATVTLGDEIEMLQLYLDMERLRFKDSFDYSIETAPDLDAGEVMIPPLLLQPFVENAIWHGLMHKEGRGHLLIRINLVGQVLTCVIRDDGVGRRNAALLKSKSVEKHKSMGLQITAERMALMTGSVIEEPFFTIRDLYDGGAATGTEVTLKIRIYDKGNYCG
jgi:tetratricopeptide (TPR) repeat protein